jgi:hypothetical protein
MWVDPEARDCAGVPAGTRRRAAVTIGRSGRSGFIEASGGVVATTIRR